MIFLEAFSVIECKKTVYWLKNIYAYQSAISKNNNDGQFNQVI